MDRGRIQACSALPAPSENTCASGAFAAASASREMLLRLAEYLEVPLRERNVLLVAAGFAPRIANLPQWREHILNRLRRLIQVSGDPVMVELLAELKAYPVPDGAGPELDFSAPDAALPLCYMSDAGPLTFISTITTFGTPLDVTLSELAVEAFFPADEATAEALARP